MDNQDHSEDVKRYNDWYSGYYKNLINWSKRNHIETDIVHDSYLKVIDRISKNGFVGDAYITYTKFSIKNYKINLSKKENNLFFLTIDDQDWVTTIENVLLEKDFENDQSLIYQDELLFFSKALFKFLEHKKYNEEWMFIFKSYYLTPNRFTYKKLTEATGVNKNKCTLIISTMKKDIKENLLNWVKENKDNL